MSPDSRGGGRGQVDRRQERADWVCVACQGADSDGSPSNVPNDGEARGGPGSKVGRHSRKRTRRRVPLPLHHVNG